MSKLLFYQYKLLKIENLHDSVFNSIEQYGFKAKCLNPENELEYRLNFYRYRAGLFITDFFPAIWESDPDCFRKLTSKEGYAVNIRKIITTCFFIFHNEVFSRDNQNAMVLSGSYAFGEQPLAETGISRKLKVYRDIFIPLAYKYDYQLIDIFELNAVIMSGNMNRLAKKEIIGIYHEFKENAGKGKQ